MTAAMTSQVGTSLVEMLASGEVKFTLGELIRKAREDAGMKKQDDLAALLRVSRAAVGAWENNVNPPSHATMLRIAELTHKPIGFFPDEHGVPMTPWTGEDGPDSAQLFSLSAYRRRHSPSTKP